MKSNGDDRNQIQGIDSINWAFVDSWFSSDALPTHFIIKVKNKVMGKRQINKQIVLCLIIGSFLSFLVAWEKV